MFTFFNFPLPNGCRRLAAMASSPSPHFLRQLDSISSMDELKQIQASVIKSNSLKTPSILAKIISCALSSSANLDHARSLLASIDKPTALTYNSVFRSLRSKNKESLPAFITFYIDMLKKSIFPDNYTFPCLLNLCANFRALPAGEALHSHVVKMGFDAEVYTVNNLMRLYVVCGEVGAAQQLFDGMPARDLVSWTTLISGLAKAGFAKEAVELFVEMVDQNLRVDGVTMVAVLSACAQLRDLEMGRNLHEYIDTYELDVDVFVGNALVDMYSKCGDVNSAYELFDGMPVRNTVSWNSMISGLAHNSESKKALELFRRMQDEGVEPDGITLVGVLNSCAQLGALELGRWIHAYLRRSGIGEDGITGNALVDMYAKCGRIDQAMEVFRAMPHRDVYSYTSIIVGLAMHGRGEEALGLFADMLRGNVKPNEVTFVGVLSACSHAGLVKVGLRHFESMSTMYGFTPQIEHYGCVVDMLARAGLLEEAQKFISSMPIKPDGYIWGSLLGACKNYSKVALGENILRHLLDVEPNGEGAYVLMSNLYASSNRHNEGFRLRKTMRTKKIRKTPGCSLVEVDGIVHEFQKGDKSHPQARQIYAMVDEFAGRLSVLSHDKSYHHSERLAIALGLISTRPSRSLTIVKNLRICDDCHNVIKSISSLYNREIVVRDRYRFHHFKDGLCSCNDFW